VTGPPGVGKFEFLLDLARTWVDAGERVVFVSLDLSPAEVRVRGLALGLRMEEAEPDRFLFVDGYSANGPAPTEPRTDRRTFTVSSYANLEGIGMTLQKAAVEVGPPARILFYTLSTLFLHNSSPAIAKFLQIITSRVKTSLGFIAYAVHEGVHEPTTMSLLRSLTDGVVELRFTPAMEREVRVHHLRGRWVDPGWRPFQWEAAAPLVGGA
jgi:KaiC/GvpD/RAD55 family RecA-like ATPase